VSYAKLFKIHWLIVHTSSTHRTLWFSRRCYMAICVFWVTTSVATRFFLLFFFHDLCDLELIYCIRNAKLASSHFFYDRRDVCIHKFWPTFVGCFQSLIDWQLMCGFVRRSAAEKRAWLPLHSI